MFVRRIPNWVAAAMFAVGCFVTLARFMWSDWVPADIAVQLNGSSKAKVVELLGEPDDLFPKGPGRRDSERWRYRPHFRIAELQIDFDDQGNVEVWNYDRF